MDQLVGFLLHPPLSEIAKKLGKMLKYTPTFKLLSAPLITLIHNSHYKIKYTNESVTMLQNKVYCSLANYSESLTYLLKLLIV